MVEDFLVEVLTGPGPGQDATGAEPDFNIAPTKQAPVVLERRPRVVETLAAGELDDDPSVTAVDEEGEASADAAVEAAQDAAQDAAAPAPVRWLRLLTWGLVPSWASDRSVGSRMINARVETLLDRTHRRAALTRRCLVPADGWYEWQTSPTAREGSGGRGRPRKQPFFIGPAAPGPVAFAGIYEFWRDREAHPDDLDAWLTTFAIITTDAEPGLRAVHDRMPLVLPPDRWDDWLDPEITDPDSVRALLEPPVAGRFLARPVATLVNAVANNGPELLEDAPAETLRGVVDPVTGELIGGGDALF